MRYVYFPEELNGFRPVWINGEFLSEAEWDHGELRVGDALFSSLYVDAEYLDLSVLNRVKKLARQGLPVTLKQRPWQAGTEQDVEWEVMIDSLYKLPNVGSEFMAQKPALVESEHLLSYWARESDQSLFLFFQMIFQLLPLSLFDIYLLSH